MIHTPAELESKLFELLPMLHTRFNVSKVGYFGSFARNQQTDTSDIDILVESPAEINKWILKDELSELFGRKVDVVINSQVLPELRDSIMEDIRYVAENEIVGAPFPQPGEKRFMKQKRYDIYLQDILKSLKQITAVTTDKDFETFIGDEVLVLAVERCFTIAGEAANKVPADAQQKHPEVPWRKMTDFRNVVVHEYDGIDYSKMWNIIKNDVPQVLACLEQVLNGLTENNG
ncbi:MAG: DUF86 domain-containing protein [Planctomycetaceae bacterium]|jgi:uncharacterized protein with HEPN domain/predicted nucleotidyltransferase|nr:DUF86 domain-containing protein [Planctomycetaceae bacterium]